MKIEFDYKTEAINLAKDGSAWQRIGRCLWQELKPEKSNLLGLILSIATGGILAIHVGTAEETVTLTADVCDILLNVQLAIFGCVLTVYSILLALISDTYVKELLKIRIEGKKTYLHRSTEYYEGAMYMYFLAIFSSLTVKILLVCLSEDFRLTQSLLIDECLACLLLSAYFIYSARVFYELKSLIGNTALLFRASLIFKIMAFSREDSQNNE